MDNGNERWKGEREQTQGTIAYKPTKKPGKSQTEEWESQAKVRTTNKASCLPLRSLRFMKDGPSLEAGSSDLGS